MQTKQNIIDAIELAIDDHKGFVQQHLGGTSYDWQFIDALRAAQKIIEAVPTVEVPEPLT